MRARFKSRHDDQHIAAGRDKPASSSHCRRRSIASIDVITIEARVESPTADLCGRVFQSERHPVASDAA